MNAIKPIAETADTVTLSRADFEALQEALEDAADLAKSRTVMARIAAGEEETMPAEVLARLIAGDNPVRVWREHRKMKGVALATAAGVPNGYLSEIERGIKPGSVDALAKLARALGVTIDDLVPPPAED